jgi:hypothetical protein
LPLVDEVVVKNVSIVPLFIMVLDVIWYVVWRPMKVPHFDFLNVMTNLGVTFFLMLERHFHAMNGVNNEGFFICWSRIFQWSHSLQWFPMFSKTYCVSWCVFDKWFSMNPIPHRIWTIYV